MKRVQKSTRELEIGTVLYFTENGTNQITVVAQGPGCIGLRDEIDAWVDEHQQVWVDADEGDER